MEKPKQVYKKITRKIPNVILIDKKRNLVKWRLFANFFPNAHLPNISCSQNDIPSESETIKKERESFRIQLE